MWFLLFTLMPFLVLVYLAWHVWVLLPLPTFWRVVVVGMGVVCFLSLFLVFGRVPDRLPLPLGRLLYVVGTSSLIVMLYLFLFFLLLDLGRLCHVVPRTLLYSNGAMCVAALLVVGGVLAYGRMNYAHKVRVPLRLTTTKPLPRKYTAVLMSDLHLGYHNPRKELARWVDLVNAEHPDVVLIAGDIIDGSHRPLIEEDMAAEFRRLRAPVYACMGNHEYYSGPAEARRFYREAGIHLLSDAAVAIDSVVVIIGRDDRTSHERKGVGELVAKVHSRLPAEQGRNPYILVLDHQPYDLPATEAAGVDFQFSGHTHRGQVWPVSWITDAVYECSWGSHQRGATSYYVSSGIGIWGGRFRIGTQSEYVVATIEQETPATE